MRTDLDENITITIKELIEITMLVHNTAGDTFMAFGGFYSNNMKIAKDASERAKEHFEELITKLEKLDKDNGNT